MADKPTQVPPTHMPPPPPTPAHKEMPEMEHKAPDTEATKKEAEKAKEKAELLDKIQRILKEYDGLESNVPQNSEYWDLLNRYRAK